MFARRPHLCGRCGYGWIIASPDLSNHPPRSVGYIPDLFARFFGGCGFHGHERTGRTGIVGENWRVQQFLISCCAQKLSCLEAVIYAAAGYKLASEPEIGPLSLSARRSLLLQVRAQTDMYCTISVLVTNVCGPGIYTSSEPLQIIGETELPSPPAFAWTRCGRCSGAIIHGARRAGNTSLSPETFVHACIHVQDCEVLGYGAGMQASQDVCA